MCKGGQRAQQHSPTHQAGEVLGQCAEEEHNEPLVLKVVTHTTAPNNVAGGRVCQRKVKGQ